ncbi:MAG: hypothetical protein IJM18_08475, partial [Clostridia bacterium]|nr:hypothetical protein [Clostridia bacterium]
WVMQKWDGEKYVDAYKDDVEEGAAHELMIIYPGERFTVKLDLAKQEPRLDEIDVQMTDPITGDPRWIYTVELKAVYGEVDTPTPTHIWWFANNETDQVQQDNDLQINEAILIPTPETYDFGAKDGTTGLVYPDHIFLGWAKLPVLSDEPTEDELAEHNEAVAALDETKLFLRWIDNGTDKHYEAKNASNAWVTVTKVAANEIKPYDDLYAVWADVFYVYHSGTNEVEQIVRTKADGVFDLANRTSDGFLYGGYYTTYAGASADFKADEGKAIEWDTVIASYNQDGTLAKTEANKWIQTDDDPGDDKQAYTNANISGITWNSTEAYKQADGAEDGLHLNPEAGKVYYIKEVPDEYYLRPYLHFTYDTGNGFIRNAWLFSDVDDLNYLHTGFYVINENDDAQGVYESVTVQATHGTGTETLTANSVFEANKGYMTYFTVINIKKGIRILQNGGLVNQYWVTPDGLIVTGTTQRTYGSLMYYDPEADGDTVTNPLNVAMTINVYNG